MSRELFIVFNREIVYSDPVFIKCFVLFSDEHDHRLITTDSGFSSSLHQSMGKPKSKKSSKAHKQQARQRKQTEYSLEELLGKAADLLDECQFELAEKFCQRALEMDADHPTALEMSANLLLERGDVDKVTLDT